MRTLAIDIGGTGIKGIVLGEDGVPITDRFREPTPVPATPEAVLAVFDRMVKALGDFDRASLGFPGVVPDGVVRTAPHLDPTWRGLPIAERVSEHLGKPVRVVNDAVIHGLGVIEGKGVEMVITLGTGVGCAVYTDGKPIHLELAHHPYRKGKTYEDMLGVTARKAVGNERWNRRIRRAIGQMEALVNYRRLYIGGGNAKHIDVNGLPENVTIIDNIAGLLGGIRLWS